MKAPRGRPKLECPTSQVRITLSLRPGEDDDLLFFFAGTPQPAARRRIEIRTARGRRQLNPGKCYPTRMI